MYSGPYVVKVYESGNTIDSKGTNKYRLNNRRVLLPDTWIGKEKPRSVRGQISRWVCTEYESSKLFGPAL